MRGQAMADTGWMAADWIAAHHADETPAEMSVRLARQAEARQDRADAQAEAERAAQIADERDRRLMVSWQLGLSGRSPSQITADAVRAADQEDRYQEALKTIEKVRRQREQQAEAHRSRAELVEAVARRSVVTDPVELAVMRARVAADDAARERAAVLEQARAQVRRSQVRRRSRPFGASGRAVADPEPYREISRSANVPESRRELEALGYGQSSRGGCAPCDGCGYVICRCGQR